jgi:hypothetical protein
MMQNIPKEIPMSDKEVRNLLTINSCIVSRKELARILRVLRIKTNLMFTAFIQIKIC